MRRQDVSDEGGGGDGEMMGRSTRQSKGDVPSEGLAPCKVSGFRRVLVAERRHC